MVDPHEDKGEDDVGEEARPLQAKLASYLLLGGCSGPSYRFLVSRKNLNFRSRSLAFN
jgi:hypothetical protein